jgi:hypothetical protein
LKRGSDYFKGKELELDNDFFALLDEAKPVTLKMTKKGGSYYSPGTRTVAIENGERLARSDWYRIRIVYHEYGHAIDWQRGLRTSPATTELMTRWRNTLGKKAERVIYSREYSFAANKWVYTRQKVKISTIADIDNRLVDLIDRIHKTPLATFERFGVKKFDVLEQIGAIRDTLMAINPKYGAGHKKSYFKQSGAREAEFLAHAFENAFAGNPIFKKYLPELYDEMTAYIRALK